MSEVLRSNVIISTKLVVTKEGFKSAHASISNIKKRLTEITQQEYEIKIKVDPGALTTLKEFSKAARALKESGATVVIKNAAGATSKHPGVLPPYIGGQLRGKETTKTTRSKDEEGNVSSSNTYTSERERRKIEGTLEKIDKHSRTSTDEMEDVLVISSKETKNLEEQYRLKQERLKIEREISDQQKLSDAKAKLRENVERAGLKARALGAGGFKENEAARKLRESDIVSSGNIAGTPGTPGTDARKLVYTQREYVRQLAGGRELVVRINEAENTHSTLIRKSASQAAALADWRKKEAEWAKKTADQQKAALDAQAKTQKKLERTDSIRANVRKSMLEGASLKSAGYKEDPHGTRTREFTVHRMQGGGLVEDKARLAVQKDYVKQLANGYEQVTRVNEALGTSYEFQRKSASQAAAKAAAEKIIEKSNKQVAKDAAEALRLKKLEAAEQEKIDKKIATKYQYEQEMAAFKKKAEKFDTRMVEQGYKRGAVRSMSDHRTGNYGEEREYYKVARDGLARYSVELRKANTLTGKFTQETLTGARAAKYLGDSIGHTIEKVLMWTGATSIVFSMIAGLKSLGKAAMDLEANTVFLARVGSNIRGAASKLENVGFEEKFRRDLVAADELTEGIVQLTTVIGGSATEAQKAASVFLRMGQTKEEVLLSVKAALIASKIAELEIADAADLISSAMLQFNITAKQILPTLDSLNTLSNNYKVTTDDLLQSISRAGSVFADHSGRLTELAAITAIIGKRTSRTGTQIGNALKTIQSRLDRLEIRKEIGDSLAMTLQDMNGEAKSLSSVLIELEASLDGLNSTQKKDLTLNIAGIRQRNILNAAMIDTMELLDAENKALDVNSTEFNGQGSAMLEAMAASMTLQASIDRLKASFVQIAENARGPLLEIATSLINMVNAIVKIDAATGGMISKVAIWAGFIFAIKKSIDFTLLLFAALKNHAIALSVAAKTIGMNMTATALATRGATTAANGLQVAMAGVRAMTGTLLTTVLAIVASLAIASMADTTSSLQGIKSLRESSLELAEKEVEHEERRLQAVNNTIGAMTTLLAIKRDLEKRGKDTGHVDSMINKGMSSIGITDTSGPVTEGNTLEKLLERQSLAYKDAADAAKGLMDSQLEQMDANRNENIALADKIEFYNELQDVIKRQRDIGNTGVTLADAVGIRAYEQGLGRPGNFAKIAEYAAKGFEDYQANLADNKKLTEEYAEAEKKLQRNASLQKSMVDNKEAIRDAQRAMIDASETFEKYQESVKNAELFSDVLGTSRIRDYTTELKELDEQAEKLDKAITIFDANGLGDEEIAKRYVKTLFEIIEAEKNLRVERAKKDNAEVMSYFKASSSSRRRMMGDVNSDVNFQRRMQNAPGQTDELAQMNAMRNELGADIGRSATRIGQISRKEGMFSGIDDQGKALLIKSEQEHMQESLNEKAKLEIDYALKLLDTERQITIERKKSAEEAAKALGILSDEDKLRVRAQAAFFAKNPNKKLSFEEQFYGDQDSNQILQKFFGGHMEDLNPQGMYNVGGNGDLMPVGGLTGVDTSFRNQFYNAGFGGNNELDKAQTDSARYRGGASDQQIRERAMYADAQYRQYASNAGGSRMDNMSAFNDNSSAAYVGQYNNVPDIKTKMMDTERMVAGIERVVEAAIVGAEAEFTAQIKALEVRMKTKRPSKITG